MAQQPPPSPVINIRVALGYVATALTWLIIFLTNFHALAWSPSMTARDAFIAAASCATICSLGYHLYRLRCAYTAADSAQVREEVTQSREEVAQLRKEIAQLRKEIGQVRYAEWANGYEVAWEAIRAQQTPRVQALHPSNDKLPGRRHT